MCKYLVVLGVLVMAAFNEVCNGYPQYGYGTDLDRGYWQNPGNPGYSQFGRRYANIGPPVGAYRYLNSNYDRSRYQYNINSGTPDSYGYGSNSDYEGIRGYGISSNTPEGVGREGSGGYEYPINSGTPNNAYSPTDVGREGTRDNEYRTGSGIPTSRAEGYNAHSDSNDGSSPGTVPGYGYSG